MATRTKKSAAKSVAESGRPSVPKYFRSTTWAARLARIIAAGGSTQDRDFAKANAERVKQHLSLDKSLRVVFNLGGHALLSYLRTGDYKNIYETPVIGGQRREPSPTRIEADALIDLRSPQRFYFCALASGGTGIRYYGEYCVVLRPRAAMGAVVKVLDRNSYDLLVEPIKGYLIRLRGRKGSADLVQGLMASLTDGTVQDMLATKVLQRTLDQPRLLTAGAVANAILSDEDYCEAYHRGKIDLQTIEEVREHSADLIREGEIVRRLQSGENVRCEEQVWALRRRIVRRLLIDKQIPSRVAADSGRSGRWS